MQPRISCSPRGTAFPLIVPLSVRRITQRCARRPNRAMVNAARAPSSSTAATSPRVDIAGAAAGTAVAVGVGTAALHVHGEPAGPPQICPNGQPPMQTGAKPVHAMMHVHGAPGAPVHTWPIGHSPLQTEPVPPQAGTQADGEPTSPVEIWQTGQPPPQDGAVPLHA